MQCSLNTANIHKLCAQFILNKVTWQVYVIALIEVITIFPHLPPPTDHFTVYKHMYIPTLLILYAYIFFQDTHAIYYISREVAVVQCEARE